MQKDVEKFEKVDDFLKESYEISKKLSKLELDAKALYEGEEIPYFKEVYKRLNDTYYKAAMELLESNVFISSGQIRLLINYVTDLEKE